MNRNLKYAPMALLGIMMTMLVLSSLVVAQAAGPGTTTGTPQSKDVQGYKHQERVVAGNAYQFKFQNQAKVQTQMKLQVNASMDVEMECDSDNIGNREFGLQLNSSENLGLKVKMNASDSSVGLQDGQAVSADSQNRYRFQHRLMVKLELNKTGEPIKARLTANITDTGATWAYYDEATQKWKPVPSAVQDGELVAETDHFSIWAVITEDSTIDGYSVVGVIAALGVIGLLVVKRKH